MSNATTFGEALYFVLVVWGVGTTVGIFLAAVIIWVRLALWLTRKR